MRSRRTFALLALATLVVLTAVVAGAASATPSKTSTCTSCHSGAASGTVTATPSTSTPAAGAAHTVAISIGLTSGGNSGYQIAQTDAAGTAIAWSASGGPAAQTSWTANMVAPATAGTYYYKVWCVKGPASSSGQAKAATYSITVPAGVPAAAISSLAPSHAQTGASVVISGSGLGSGGTVRFGSTAATTTAWSATSVTATVPASLAAGASSVTVTPTGGAASNALAFTVDAPPAPNSVLTGLSPASGPVGAALTITGTGLGTSGGVTVGGITAATIAWSSTSITCTVPAGLTIGTKNVVVTPAGAAASNSLSFMVTVPPAPVAAITSVTPNHAQTGASVVISGSDLGSGGTVRFGSTVATTTVWSATSVTAAVPASLAAGATSVTVTPTGGAASNALPFTVDAPPAPGDTTAPATTAGGATANGWCNGSVDVTLTATDDPGGSGVASITYMVDGGTPVIAAGSSVTVTVGQTVVGAPGATVEALQGPHTLAFYARDIAGNGEAAQTLTVNLDTQRPATRAPHSARARRHHPAVLQFEVRDGTPNAGTATVVISIKNRRGKVVKTLHLPAQPVNTVLTARFACSLKAGAYRYSVRATDAAGNKQANVASQRLTVR